MLYPGKKIFVTWSTHQDKKIVMLMSPKNSIARQDLKFLSFLGLSTGRKSGQECVILQIVKLRNHSNAGKWQSYATHLVENALIS